MMQNHIGQLAIGQVRRLPKKPIIAVLDTLVDIAPVPSRIVCPFVQMLDIGGQARHEREASPVSQFARRSASGRRGIVLRFVNMAVTVLIGAEH